MQGRVASININAQGHATGGLQHDLFFLIIPSTRCNVCNVRDVRLYKKMTSLVLLLQKRSLL